MSYSIVADDIKVRTAIIHGDVAKGSAAISGSISGTAKGELKDGIKTPPKTLSGIVSEKTITISGAIIGATSGSIPYVGPYEVTPLARKQTVLKTANKKMTGNVTVKEIPYWETSNESGLTVYIGGTE